MKRFRKPLSVSTALLAALLIPISSVVLGGAVWAEEPSVAILSDIHVGKGEVRHDDVVCIGGTATIEGTVEGDVVVIAGKLDFSGEANDVVSVASRTHLGSGAIIHGDQVTVGGPLERDAPVTVEGEVVNVAAKFPPGIARIFSHGLIGLLIILKLISIIASLVLVVLVVLVAPARIQRMALALEPRWPASLGFGVLGYVACIILCVGLAITLIGIPVAVMLGLAVGVLGAVGVAAILLVIGKKVGAGSGLLSPTPSVLGAVLMGFLVVAIVRFIPILGEMVWLVLSVLGLGLALVTKVGSPEAEIATGQPAAP